MKYWCYYANVVRYLEKVEALFAPKTRGPAYLVWTDDDGPHMIAGPGIHWYRGDGPMPDLDSLEIPNGAARVSKRLPANPQSTPTQQNTAATVSKPSPANAQSTRPARECRAATWRKPPAHHNPETSIKPAIQPPKRRTKGKQLFRNPLKPAHKRTRPTVVRGKTSKTHPPLAALHTAPLRLVSLEKQSANPDRFEKGISNPTLHLAVLRGRSGGSQQNPCCSMPSPDAASRAKLVVLRHALRPAAQPGDPAFAGE